MKKVMVYGAAECKDCVVAKEIFDNAGIKYGYVDIMASLAHLKKFLAVRDANPAVFAHDVEEGHIGIPAIMVDDDKIYRNADNLDLFK